MLRRMIRHGFKRRNEEKDEENFSYVLSNNDVLGICKTEDIISHVEKQQFNYPTHIARRKNTD